MDKYIYFYTHTQTQTFIVIVIYGFVVNYKRFAQFPMNNRFMKKQPLKVCLCVKFGI